MKLISCSYMCACFSSWFFRIVSFVKRIILSIYVDVFLCMVLENLLSHNMFS